VFLGYRQGKPHRKYVTRRTRAEVAAELRRLLEAQRHGQLVTTGGMTVGEWFAVYLDQVARPGLRPRTFDRYSSDISGHILPAIGRHRLDKLPPRTWPRSTTPRPPTASRPTACATFMRSSAAR
jgi:integrase